MRALLAVAIITCWTSVAFSARILSVNVFPGKSTYIFQSAILKILAKRGHEVVSYCAFPPEESLENYTHVEITTPLHEKFKNITFDDIKSTLQYSHFFCVAFNGMWDIIDEVCEVSFKDKNLKMLLQSNEHFDLVITSSSIGQESMLVFGHKFNAPTVTIQGFQYASFVNREAGNALSIATIPDSMSFPFTDQMSFKERFLNFISATATLFMYYTYHLPKQEDILRKYYHHPNTPKLSEMVTNVSLTLMNIHPAITFSQPYTPNMIPVGGVAISSERKELSKEIKEFMDQGQDGVIYFSFGTVIPAHTFPTEILQVFIEVFKTIPNKVLWKIDRDNLPGLSNNVKLVKWVPQPGVLAHPNCALFLTHGGLFSHHEALHSGVPVVGVPFFADQSFNLRFAEHKGIGVKVNLHSLSESTLRAALVSVLHNPKYRENARRLSQIYHDRPLSPADSVVYWVEYVLKHGGAAHLRPAAAYLPWYQFILLDVFTAVVTALFISLLLLYFFIKQAVLAVCASKKATKVTQKKIKNK